MEANICDIVNTDYINFELNQAMELIKISITQNLSEYESKTMFIAINKTLRELQNNIKRQIENEVS